MKKIHKLLTAIVLMTGVPASYSHAMERDEALARALGTIGLVQEAVTGGAMPPELFGRLQFQGNARKIEERECSLCLERLIKDDTQSLTALPCGHIFHNDCIRPVLQGNRLCPLCRRAVAPGAEKILPIGQKEKDLIFATSIAAINRLHGASPEEKKRIIDGIIDAKIGNEKETIDAIPDLDELGRKLFFQDKIQEIISTIADNISEGGDALEMAIGRILEHSERLAKDIEALAPAPMPAPAPRPAPMPAPAPMHPLGVLPPPPPPPPMIAQFHRTTREEDAFLLGIDPRFQECYKTIPPNGVCQPITSVLNVINREDRRALDLRVSINFSVLHFLITMHSNKRKPTTPNLNNAFIDRADIIEYFINRGAEIQARYPFIKIAKSIRDGHRTIEVSPEIYAMAQRFIAQTNNTAEKPIDGLIQDFVILKRDFPDLYSLIIDELTPLEIAARTGNYRTAELIAKICQQRGLPPL